MNDVAIVADIGGTNARFAQRTINNTELSDVVVYACEAYESLAEAIQAYITQRCGGQSVVGVCVAIAGPVIDDWIYMPNSHWSFSQQALSDTFGVKVQVINDFTAQALAIPAFREADLRCIGLPKPKLDNTCKAILGAGTGLGVAALTPSGEVVPSEGGHVSFAPTNDHEIAILQTLWKKYERISTERLLSGMGLENLYWANSVIEGKEASLSAPDITAAAHQGDALSLLAIQDFYQILAATAGDVALMFGATGGVFISGGVVPKTLALMDGAAVRERFEAKGRYSEILQNMALSVVVADQPGLMGCAQAVELAFDT